MFRLFFPAIGLALLLTVGFASGASAARAEKDLGHFETDCVSCHLAPGNTAPEQAHRLTADQQRLCGECHEGVAEMSHPTGFTPSRSLPAEFPLDERGEMSCSTCHDLHNDTPGRTRSAKRGGELCKSCHPASFFSAMADRGSSLMNSGHLGADARPGGPVDAFSMQCMTCHSDNATLSERRFASRRFSPSMVTAANHPIGADYRQFAVSRDYHPASSIPAELVLPEGKVSCVTCHEGYPRKHGEVRQADRLCVQCHNK